MDGQILASVHYDLWGRSGEVVIDGAILTIRRKRTFCPEWVLSATNGAQVAEAYRYDTGVKLFWNDGTEIRLERAYPFIRRVRIIIGGPVPGLITTLGVIAPDRPFSRKATLSVATPLPRDVLVCCLWLWRWVIAGRN